MKSQDTRPEVLLTDACERVGLRAFITHDRTLPGTPDITFNDERLAVFVHGCYWHRHLGCRHATYPKQNTAAWVKRFNDNVRRDQAAMRQLRDLGWTVYVAWECDILRRPRTVAEHIHGLLEPRAASAVT